MQESIVAPTTFGFFSVIGLGVTVVLGDLWFNSIPKAIGITIGVLAFGASGLCGVWVTIKVINFLKRRFLDPKLHTPISAAVGSALAVYIPALTILELLLAAAIPQGVLMGSDALAILVLLVGLLGATGTSIFSFFKVRRWLIRAEETR